MHKTGSLEEMGDFLVKKKSINKMEPKIRKIQTDHLAPWEPCWLLSLFWASLSRQGGTDTERTPQPVSSCTQPRPEGVSGVTDSHVAARTFPARNCLDTLAEMK